MVGGKYLDADAVIMEPDSSIMRLSKESKLSRVLSRSTPSMTASVETLSTRSSSTVSLSISPSTSRQKKFHQYFREVPIEERVLSYHMCALARDILLQGHLYITPNYFGFYSNIFGYVTKVLIPVSSVIDISKKMAVKIIPKAIVISTQEERHVFSFLFWKDSTFELMNQLWDDTKDPTSSVPAIRLSGEGNLSVPQNNLGDSSVAISDTEDFDLFKTETQTDWISTPSTACMDVDGFSDSIHKPVTSTIEPILILRRYFEPDIIIAILVALLAILFISTTLMMIRINRLHTAYSNYSLVLPEYTIDNQLLQELRLNVNKIVKVRQCLQVMSEHLAAITKSIEVQPTRDSVFDPQNAPL